jgi:uncharacterized glyoxalase superfamily protein PhnB
LDLDAADGFDPASNRTGCYLSVAGVDEGHARLVAADLPVTELVDQPWGMREFTLTDPSGNAIQVVAARRVDQRARRSDSTLISGGI